MSHLSPERIAALTDEAPTPVEAAHLGECAACTAEFAAQRKLARLAAAAQPVAGPPLSSFNALLPRLAAEGLVVRPDRGAVMRRWSLRVAAGLALVLGGGVVGRMTADTGLPVLPKGNGAGGGTTVAASAPGTQFTSPDDAVQALNVSQKTYENAAAYLAAQDTSAHFIGLSETTYRTRLQALDQMAAITRAALYQAPQDPMLNQAYLATQSARATTLRQINQAMPAAKRLGSY